MNNSQAKPRVTDDARPFQTTQARLKDALDAMQAKAASASKLVDAWPVLTTTETASGPQLGERSTQLREPGAMSPEEAAAAKRLRDAQVQLANAVFERRAIHAIATCLRTSVANLSLKEVVEAGTTSGLFELLPDPAVKIEDATLKLEPLEMSHTKCPACGELLLIWTPTGATITYPHQKHYPNDGDCIPGAPQQLFGCDSAVTALVGTCPYCLARYWSLEVMLDTRGEGALLEAMQYEPDWDAQFTAGADWMAYVAHNAAGHTFQHFVGPMLVPSHMATHGPNGVSACRGGYFWRHALSVFEAHKPKLEAIQQQLVQTSAPTIGGAA
ncbi:hypothetical protein [Xanthomonas campestris]|uniref:hypothetical protein n=1 Tax=Xanthomonas campestris TaxID=339 RepID=UPI003555D112